MEENNQPSQDIVPSQQKPDTPQNVVPQQPTAIKPSFQQPLSPTYQPNPSNPNLQTQPTPQQPLQNKSQTKKFILGGIVIIIVISLGLGGWLLSKKTNNSSSIKTSNVSNKKDPVNRASLLDTAAWSVFSSKLYGVSVNIPPNWVAVDLPLTNPYPGIIISSPALTLGQKSHDGKNTGVFSIHIRTSKIADQKNNFFQANDVGSLAKCQVLSVLKLNSTDYKIAATAYSINNTPEDPYSGAPYNNSSLFDKLHITSECVASKFGDSAGGLKPNFQVDKTGLILTSSANFNTAKPEQRGNVSTAIPFTIKELDSNKGLETFSTILSTLKAN